MMINEDELTDRINTIAKRMKGVEIAKHGGVEFIDVGKWKVRGQTKPYYYVVQIGKDLFMCDCPDFNNRGFKGKIGYELDDSSESEFIDCKHISGVRYIIENGANNNI